MFRETNVKWCVCLTYGGKIVYPTYDQSFTFPSWTRPVRVLATRSHIFRFVAFCFTEICVACSLTGSYIILCRKIHFW